MHVDLASPFIRLIKGMSRSSISMASVSTSSGRTVRVRTARRMDSRLASNTKRSIAFFLEARKSALDFIVHDTIGEIADWAVAFQKKGGLKVTGKLDPETLKALGL